MDEVQFFSSSSEFRAWLETHHRTAAELWVGFQRKSSGTPSITYRESLDQALCFGWIDGVRRRIDGNRYTVRFTRRKTGSLWSAVNTRRFQELAALGAVTPPGLRAFQARDQEDSARQAQVAASHRGLDETCEERLRANKEAWDFWERQPPGYRRTASRWVMSAKREATRFRRLNVLIAVSERGTRLDPLKPLDTSERE
ncbi:MAG: bacteriocin-protection protein [SAR202 cluster bacterium]|nr:bacteriocin-protection protein [SAR202 cluster bacterium]